MSDQPLVKRFRQDAQHTKAVTEISNLFLKEIDVGITEYRNKHSKPIGGILKQRFSDFHVHEIDSEGRLVRLENFDLPQSSLASFSKPLDTMISTPTTEDMSPFTILARFCLKDSDISAIIRLSDSIEEPTECVTIEFKGSKDERTKFHQSIRAALPTLTSTTIESGLLTDTKQIRIEKLKSLKKKRIGKSVDWPSPGNDYCSFVLYKENKDTTEAIHYVSRALHLPHKRFAVAGTKDRRGITSQQVTVYKISAERLSSLNAIWRKHGNSSIRVGNFRYVTKPLQLGLLQGNHFDIVLRSIQLDNEEIESSLLSLKTFGFVNYFGMQRFGTQTIPTFEVGKAILKNEWERAVKLILDPRDGEDNDTNLARKRYKETMNADYALEILPNKCIAERKLLEALRDNGQPPNYCTAFSAIPRPLRLMYVHSYQSLLWNKLVSRRLREYGDRVLEGDIVVLNEEIVENEDSIESDIPSLIDENEVVDNEVKEVPLDVRVSPLIKILKADEIEKYTLKDIVMPLHGCAIKYPGNSEIYSWYEELLKEDGMSALNLQHKQKDYILHGNYRKVVSFVKNLQWQVIDYDDPHVSLIESDIQRLESKYKCDNLCPEKQGSENESGARDIHDRQGVLSRKALLLGFDLGKAQYATMALREIMKTDTSQAYQASLNV